MIAPVTPVKHGIYGFIDTRPPIAIHVSIVNDFFLHPQTIKQLKSHYILHWEKDYLIKRLNENGTLIHADVEYIPIRRINLDNPLIQKVRLSFRQPKPELNIPSYVLIKAA